MSRVSVMNNYYLGFIYDFLFPLKLFRWRPLLLPWFFTFRVFFVCLWGSQNIHILICGEIMIARDLYPTPLFEKLATLWCDFHMIWI